MMIRSCLNPMAVAVGQTIDWLRATRNHIDYSVLLKFAFIEITR